MTIDEAIKEQQDALADKWCPWSLELKQAIKLSTESLKRIKRSRELDGKDWLSYLPGET